MSDWRQHDSIWLALNREVHSFKSEPKTGVIMLAENKWELNQHKTNYLLLISILFSLHTNTLFSMESNPTGERFLTNYNELMREYTRKVIFNYSGNKIFQNISRSCENFKLLLNFNALKRRKKFKNSQNYNIFLKNCLHFLVSIMNSILFKRIIGNIMILKKKTYHNENR